MTITSSELKAVLANGPPLDFGFEDFVGRAARQGKDVEVHLLFAIEARRIPNPIRFFHVSCDNVIDDATRASITEVWTDVTCEDCKETNFFTITKTEQSAYNGLIRDGWNLAAEAVLEAIDGGGIAAKAKEVKL